MTMPKHTPSDFKRLPNEFAIVSFEGKTLMTSWHYLDVLAQEHAIAFTVAKIMDEDLLKEVNLAMQDAIKNGTSFNDFQKRLKPYLMSRGWWGEQVSIDPKDGQGKKVQLGSTRRLRTIYDTNKRTARASGRWQRIQKTKDRFPYLEYRKSLSENKRLDHKRYYGLVLPVDSPIWKEIFPPNGYGCKCRTRQLTAKEAEALGISDDFELEFEDFENPRTGKTSKVPKGIEPSFAHNHDRLSAIMALAKEKHGDRFVQLTKQQVDEYMLELLVPKHIPIVDFKDITPNELEVKRLAKDGKKTRLAEGVIASQWQISQDVTLYRFDENKHTFLLENSPPDFVIADKSKHESEWLSLDFMFTLEEGADIAQFNRSFTKSDIAWQKRQNKIKQHLAKADIVPLYLGNFDTTTRTKLLIFVLSLSKEQQKKIVLITGG